MTSAFLLLTFSLKGFWISIYDDKGRGVSKAWVQWIAIIPDKKLHVLGGIKRASGHQHIVFPVKLPKTPVIITNAQKEGLALASCAVDNSPTGFYLAIRDHNNKPVKDAWLLWLAVIPGPWNGLKGNVELRDHGSTISLLRAFDYKIFKITVPTNDFYPVNVTIIVDIKGVINKTAYATPVGGSAAYYGVKVIAGITEGSDIRGVERKPGYKRVVWQKASDPFKDFLETAGLTIISAGAGYAVPGADVILILESMGKETIEADEVVNRKYKVKFRNIRLKGNQKYTVYVYLEGIAKVVSLGLASGVCEIDFYYHKHIFLMKKIE
ncbi:MAG: hypothetical protein J7M03_01910 [Candidatus Desulfofervidaceae bacterium]|nr:hypothetical protein [Candidatus Desulfofervidaceae bacterium]